MDFFKELAKVESFDFNIKDRGILTFYITVKYENGFHQGIGGLTLDDYDKAKKCRVGTAYGCEMIRQLLLFFNVDNPRDAVGKYLYVLGEGEGLSFAPRGIQRLSVDDEKEMKVVFSEVFDEFGTVVDWD